MTDVMDEPDDLGSFQHPIFRILPGDLRMAPTFGAVKSFLHSKARRLRWLSFAWLLAGIVIATYWMLSQKHFTDWPLLFLGGWAIIGASIFSRAQAYELSDEEIANILGNQ